MRNPRQWLGICVLSVVAAITGCADDPAVSARSHESYLVTVPGPVPTTMLCQICPISNAKAAAGEPVSTLCTQHCENCGNGTCDLDETNAACPSDCPGDCGNGLCEPGESPFNCQSDCGPPPSSCGNGVCETGEVGTCQADCGPFPVCGDGLCEGNEAFSCPADCGIVCPPRRLCPQPAPE